MWVDRLHFVLDRTPFQPFSDEARFLSGIVLTCASIMWHNHANAFSLVPSWFKPGLKSWSTKPTRKRFSPIEHDKKGNLTNQKRLILIEHDLKFLKRFSRWVFFEKNEYLVFKVNSQDLFLSSFLLQKFPSTSVITGTGFPCRSLNGLWHWIECGTALTSPECTSLG